jgi:hypothetical protein
MSRWQKCSIAGCLRPMKAKGLCDAHYNRLKHAGLKPELPVRSLDRQLPPRTRQDRAGTRL